MKNIKKLLALTMALLIAALTFASCGAKTTEIAAEEAYGLFTKAAQDPAADNGKADLTAAVSVKGEEDGEEMNLDVNVKGGLRFTGVKSGKLAVAVSLEADVAGMDRITAIFGKDPIKLDIVYVDGVAYADLETSSSLPQLKTMKMKLDVDLSQIADLASAFTGEQAGGQFDEAKIKEALSAGMKSAVLTEKGSQKTVEATYDLAKLISALAGEEMNDDVKVNADVAVREVMTAEDKPESVQMSANNATVEAEGGKGAVTFDVSLQYCDVEAITAPADASEYTDAASLLGGLLGGSEDVGSDDDSDLDDGGFSIGD